MSVLPSVSGVMLAAAILACSAEKPADDAPAAELERATFIEVYSALRRAHHTAESVEQFEAARDQILAQHGTTTREVLAFVQRHGQDLTLMREVWDSIEARLARMTQDGAGAAPPEPSP